LDEIKNYMIPTEQHHW